MKKVKNIIVATDFSVISRNAYQYALRLAEKLDASITVVHVNEYILPGAELTVSPISELEINRMTNTSMALFVAEEDDREDHVMTKTRLKTKILRGDSVDQLVELSKSGDTDLMVLGTAGLKDFFSKIIGTKSIQIAKDAHCPVLLVPGDARWQPIEQVMFASNYDSTTPAMIKEITGFAGLFNARIHFVNVRDISADKEDDAAEIRWDALFPTTQPVYPFEVHSIYGHDTILELNDFAENNQIDLLAFVSKHRGFWKNLMHKSITEEISLSTNIPLMVIHLDDMPQV